MKITIFCLILISLVLAQKSDTLMTKVSTKMVDDVTGENQMYQGVQFETPRFTGHKVEKSQETISKEQSMNKFGLTTVDSDMEIEEKEYKKTSEKKQQKTEATNKKISKSLEDVKNELDGKVEKIDDEDVLLKALLKLAILKKAVQIHIDEIEANVVVDMKIQDQVIKQIAEYENLVKALDDKDEVFKTYVVRDHWLAYTTYVDRSYGFVSLFRGVWPYRRGKYVFGWMPYLTRYFRYSWSYYWPYVSFGFWGYSYYDLYTYLPTTYYYSSFVDYYHYAYLTDDEIAALEDAESKAEEELNEGLAEMDDQDATIEDLEEDMNEAVEGLKEINSEITEIAENLIDQVTEGNPDESSELAKLDLTEKELFEHSDEILASFDEEIATEVASGDEDPELEPQEHSDDEPAIDADENGSALEDAKEDNDDLAEIEDLEGDLLGSASEAEYNDEDADEHSEIEVSGGSDAENNDEEADEHSEIEVQEGGSDAEANEEDSNDAFNDFNDPELNDEEEESAEDESVGEEEEEDPCEEYKDDPQAYQECQRGDEKEEHEQDHNDHQEMSQGSEMGAPIRNHKTKKIVSGFKKSMKKFTDAKKKTVRLHRVKLMMMRRR